MLLGLAAAFAVLASAMPRPAAWPLAMMAVAHGLRLRRTQLRRRRRQLLFPGGDALPTCDGDPMQRLRAHWRGPLLVLAWHAPGSGPRRLAFWPDTLPEAARRELRLALLRAQAAPGAASVAP